MRRWRSKSGGRANAERKRDHASLHHGDGCCACEKGGGTVAAARRGPICNMWQSFATTLVLQNSLASFSSRRHLSSFVPFVSRRTSTGTYVSCTFFCMMDAAALGCATASRVMSACVSRGTVSINGWRSHGRMCGSSDSRIVWNFVMYCAERDYPEDPG